MLTAVREAYTSGLNTIGVVCAVLIAVTAVIAATALRKVGSQEGDGGGEEEKSSETSATEGSLSGSA